MSLCISPRPALLALALSCSACASGSTGEKPPATAAEPPPSGASGQPPALREPEWLPPAAREMIAARMQRHGEEMLLLLISVVVLSHEDTEQLAEQIAAEPRIGRPAPGEKDTLEALLPERFFELQDQLRDRARAVAQASRTKNDMDIVHAYGQLAETCVGCHSVYLNPEAPEPERL